MTVKEYSTKFNSLAMYAPRVANTNKEKIRIFINGLRSDIVHHVMMRDLLEHFDSWNLTRVME